MRKRLKSMAYMVLAASTMTFSQVLMRWASAGHDVQPFPIVLSFWKYCGIALGAALWLGVRRSEAGPQRFRPLPTLVFGMSDAAASTALFFGALYVPLGINSLLGDLHMLLAPCVLFFVRPREVPVGRLFLLVLGFVGVVILANNPSASLDDKALLLWFPIAGSCLWCLATFAARHLYESSRAMLQLVTAVCGIGVTILVLALLQRSPSVAHYGSFSFIAACAMAMLAQIFFVASMTAGDVLSALLAAPSYAGFGAIFGWVFFGERVTAMQAGAVLLIASTLCVASYMDFRESKAAAA